MAGEIFEILVKHACRFPWERLISYQPSAAHIPQRSFPPPELQALPAARVFTALPAPVPAAATETPEPAASPAHERLARPGCTAADEMLTIKGHLEGLAAGLGGFGVLKTDIPRLDRAMAGAQQMGDGAVAQEISALKSTLPAVTTPEAARRVLDQQVAPLIPKVWDLGKRCSMHVSPELLKRAKELATQVASGTLTRDKAIDSLRAAQTNQQEPTVG